MICSNLNSSICEFRLSLRAKKRVMSGSSDYKIAASVNYLCINEEQTLFD